MVGGGGSDVWVGSEAALDLGEGSRVGEDFSGTEVGAAGVVPAVVGAASAFEEGDSESEGSSPVWPVRCQVSLGISCHSSARQIGMRQLHDTINSRDHGCEYSPLPSLPAGSARRCGVRLLKGTIKGEKGKKKDRVRGGEERGEYSTSFYPPWGRRWRHSLFGRTG